MIAEVSNLSALTASITRLIFNVITYHSLDQTFSGIRIATCKFVILLPNINLFSNTANTSPALVK